MPWRLPAFPSLAALQVSGVTVGLAALAFAPPASGRMLLIPLSADAAARLVPSVIARGGRLIGPGPLPRSYVFVGDRARIAGSLRDGVVALAAPPAGCGGTR